MRIESIRALPGPNIYVHRPLLKARIELEDLTEKESTDFPAFADRLVAALPGLRDHHCAKGEPGGFVERLHGGTYFGHTVEHCAIELQNLAGVKVNFGRTVYADAPGRYDMLVEYRNEPVARHLIQVAMEFVQATVRGHDYPLAAKLEETRHLLADTDLGPSTRAIVDAAERRGIPAIRLSEGNLVQLGYGVHRRLIQAAQSDRTSEISVGIAGDKAFTKRLLADAAIPVPRGEVVRSREDALAAFRGMQPPVAIKPLNGNQGRGISLRLKSEDEVGIAYDLASQISRDVVIEEFLTGRDYRVIVVDGRMVAAAERVPAHVVGDGRSTVQQLVDRENRNPHRGEGHEKALTKIKVDAVVSAYLARAGLTLDHVPAAGERAFLRETANLSTGGTARDVTDDVHPDVARLCERAARVVGLDICGVDLILPDVAQPVPAEGGAGIVELNAAPGIRMHHFPSEGKPRDVGAAIVRMLYPGAADGRVPIVAITGTNGKTTVTRLIDHVLRESGVRTGMTTTDGIYVDGHLVAQGDMTGFHSARAILSDPLVEAAVLETARGGIMRRSLGYDWSDVGVLTNIQPDHLGQDGIDTVDDLLFVKSLVAERVREGGTLVLNADDERLATLPGGRRVKKLRRKVVFFARSAENPVVRDHLRGGGTAYFLADGWLVEANGDRETPVVREDAVPITLGGAATFQTANALAALAACRAVGVSVEQAASALSSFRSGDDNPGRMNLYRVARGYVLIDYGHNVGAFEALCDLTTRFPERRITGVFTVPGDRDDALIREAARAAVRCFDRLIIREDEDLRGRQPGEVSRMLCDVAREEAPEKECRIVHEEAAALRIALEEMEEGEIVVFFYEKYTHPGLEVLNCFGARQATRIEPVAVQA